MVGSDLRISVLIVEWSNQDISGQKNIEVIPYYLRHGYEVDLLDII